MGGREANALGLTTQVPVREVYLTSGPSRRLRLGAQEIELRHAPAWQLILPGRSAGSAVRALAWLGRERAHEALATLPGRLSEGDLQELIGARAPADVDGARGQHTRGSWLSGIRETGGESGRRP